MSKANEKLVSWLFETKAVRVCPENKPFWYTSGTIGPYYVNTHFLYGSEEKANNLLQIIDREKNDVYKCSAEILKITRENYQKDRIYKGLIDEVCTFIKNNIPLQEVSCISGGERRDWFFSLIVSEILGKPHITIYKDLSSVLFDKNQATDFYDLSNQKVLHIADLITEASSYERAWIPAVEEKCGQIKWSVVVVDRKQGGDKLLAQHGVQSFSLIGIEKELFDQALSMELINREQYQMVVDYIESPKETMKKFLTNHPEFMENALQADDKTKERARLCMEKNFYGLVVRNV